MVLLLRDTIGTTSTLNELDTKNNHCIGQAGATMANLITLLVAPMTVGIIMLVIEYFVIKPFAEKSGFGDVFTGFKNVVIAATVILVFIGVSIVVASNFRQLSTQNPLPTILFPQLGLLSDASVTLATIVYCCVALYLVTPGLSDLSFDSDDSVFSLLLIYMSAILPPILLVVWGLAFLSEYWIVLLATFILSGFWMMTILLLYQQKSGLFAMLFVPTLSLFLLSVAGVNLPQSSYPGVLLLWFGQYISLYWILKRVGTIVWIDESRIFLICLVICWPINALFLIWSAAAPTLWAWIGTAVFGGVQYYALVKLEDV